MHCFQLFLWKLEPPSVRQDKRRVRLDLHCYAKAERVTSGWR